ncbi:[FeFe] hydrogenase H-cluster maturation GTPase HydF [Desulfovibrio sp.]|uniref:[FeFe] hydrogenase H-cluster maturation GTPase HydF n=1 Tax=Desulfovibrio sp. TaxID=885 RepID=UPI0023D47945|nr:[FeFe] hydrogenase H-cluster maturation GTPase HydF [Desulfovibrio sp.]MDE7240371.1 [FeFe] hydrogenase H-cluster maturation GTPase HydF [Desulfovibrio sp.]
MGVAENAEPQEGRGAPRGLRPHIALVGRRNAGKSALLNALAGQPVSIVSETPGTTTDPVAKTMELSPLGPVVLLDTAGIDDEGALGERRVERTKNALRGVDAALLVTDGRWDAPERELAGLLAERQIPFVVVRNKADLEHAELPEAETIHGALRVSALKGEGVGAVVAALARILPEAALRQPPLLAGLMPAGGLAALVVPLDSGAPKGRLIQPQVQTIRDCLDGRASCLVTTPGEYAAMLERLAGPPDLVICDSQVVRETVAATPHHVPLTTFSILMARLKGDLAALAAGAAALEGLRPGDTVVIQEGCSHHPQADDIGRIKLPRLLRALAGGDVNVVMAAGAAFFAYPAQARAVIHCGGCVITRRQMLERMAEARARRLPMTNYGVALSLGQGVLERALSPFPEALAAYRAAREAQ